MSSSWIRTALKYTLLLAPTVLLVGLLAIVWLAAGIVAVLRDPATVSEAPSVVATLARSVYFSTRVNWHQTPDCLEFDRDLLYRPRAGACRFDNAEFSTTIRMDAMGARSTAAAAPAAPGATPKPRLVIVGDSHAMGWGVEDDETFASVLARDYGYPTINLGVPSYGTTRELLKLERDVVLAPDDILLIQYCNNDLNENRRYLRLGSIGPYDQEAFDKLAAARPIATAPLPVAGHLIRKLWQELQALAGRRQSRTEAGADPSTAFLAVLAKFPAQVDRRVIVLALEEPGVRTHLEREPLADAGLPLIVPVVAREDYYELDDHMRPRGHRTVAAAIDAAVMALGPQRPD